MAKSRDQLPESPREHVGARRLGRAGFLGVVGAGVATLFYGNAVSRVVSKVTNPVADATGLTRFIPSSGWRIYTVADSMPSFDPATWRLRIDGLVRRPVELNHRRLLALPKATQWKVDTCSTRGSARSCAYVSVIGRRTRPVICRRQVAGSKEGIESATV